MIVVQIIMIYDRLTITREIIRCIIIIQFETRFKNKLIA